MEYIDNFDQHVTKLLKNDIIYIVFIILVILIATYLDIIEILTINLPSNINLSSPPVIILCILLVAYLSNKDLRLGILFSLIFMILYEKHKINVFSKF